MRWMILLLVGATLAGCADAPCEPDCRQDCEGNSIEDGCPGDWDHSTGYSIRGVVVDEAIVPMEGVNVTLREADRVATTDQEGRFFFKDVDSGRYVVEATALFYDEVLVSVEVTEGPATDVVKIQLTRIIFDDPYIETEVFDGFITCSSNVGGVIAEECGEGVGVPGVGRIGGNPNNKPFVTFYAEGPSPQTIQGEIVWDPSLTIGNGVQTGGFTAIMATHFVCDPICAYEHSLDDKVGYSPLVMRTDDGNQGGAYFTSPDVALADAGVTAETPITIFAWQSDEDLAGVTIEQPFRVYRTVSYVLPLPEDWSFARGDPDPFE